MTSGQGGSPDQPAGQPGSPPGQGGDPQGWHAPPPYYPPGPSVPPGYPPAPGYEPAPSAPSPWGAPQPVERPVTVRAGIGAFIAHMLLGIITTVFLFTDQRNLLDQALTQAAADTSEDVLRSALILVAVIALIFVALEAMFLWFAWKGRNWARIVLWVLFGLNVVSGLTALGGTPYGGFYTSLSVIQLLLAIAGIVLLALAPSNEWYRYRSWLRATGQGR
jgi:hypothetical protein